MWGRVWLAWFEMGKGVLMACWGGFARRQKGGHSWRRKWGEGSLFFLKMGDLARGYTDADSPGHEENQSLWPRGRRQMAGVGGSSGFLSLSTPGILN